MSYNSYFDDVQDELHRMRRVNKETSANAWVVVPIAFLVHAAVLALIVCGMTWLLGGSTAVVGVTCSAYVSAVLGWAVQRLQQRADQTALHATSVHDEVLLVKELIWEEQRKSVQWKS
jgi:membrane protein implicated in regulation of membrane protease activity